MSQPTSLAKLAQMSRGYTEFSTTAEQLIVGSRCRHIFAAIRAKYTSARWAEIRTDAGHTKQRPLRSGAAVVFTLRLAHRVVRVRQQHRRQRRLHRHLV